MKKRLVLIPLAVFAGMAAIMKLIWDSLSDSPTPTFRYDEIQTRVRKLLKERAENKLFTAARLLEELGEPRDIVESAFGETVEQIIEDFRVEKAERLLLSSDDTISCIAETVGFSDSGELYRPFKMNYGMEPSQYREKHRS